jgi:hypothetical protein
MCSDNLTSFIVWIPFRYFSCLIAVASPSSSMLNKIDKSSYLCLAFGCREADSGFPQFIMKLAASLLYVAFLCWGIFFLMQFVQYPLLGMLSFTKYLFPTIEMTI